MEERRGSMATIEHEGRPSTSLSASLIHLLVAFEGGGRFVAFEKSVDFLSNLSDISHSVFL